MRGSDERTTLLIDFLNTIDLEAHTDLLDTPDEFAAWAAAHGERPGDPVEARRIRDALRSGLQGRPAETTDLVVPMRVGLGTPPRLVPASVAEAALAASIELAAVGDWSRVKLCPADDCLEAFYDTSRNRSRIWCDMADCGNLAKVRSYRRRTAEPS